MCAHGSRTRDGAYLGMHYDGLVEKSDAHRDYDWVNTTLFLGEGRVVVPGTVEYRVYRVT